MMCMLVLRKTVEARNTWNEELLTLSLDVSAKDLLDPLKHYAQNVFMLFLTRMMPSARTRCYPMG